MNGKEKKGDRNNQRLDNNRTDQFIVREGKIESNRYEPNILPFTCNSTTSHYPNINWSLSLTDNNKT